MQRNLEHDLELTEEQAVAAMQSAPYIIPTPFPSIREASAFVIGYQQHSCKLSYENSAESHLVEDLEQRLEQLKHDIETEDQPDSTRFSDWLAWLKSNIAISAILLAAVLLLLFFLLGVGTPNGEQGEPNHRAAQKMPPPLRR